MSTNTICGHVRTLVRKLAATGRDDAVRHAREPELLEPPGPCTATPLVR